MRQDRGSNPQTLTNAAASCSKDGVNPWHAWAGPCGTLDPEQVFSVSNTASAKLDDKSESKTSEDERRHISRPKYDQSRPMSEAKVRSKYDQSRPMGTAATWPKKCGSAPGQNATWAGRWELSYQILLEYPNPCQRKDGPRKARQAMPACAPAAVHSGTQQSAMPVHVAQKRSAPCREPRSAQRPPCTELHSAEMHPSSSLIPPSHPPHAPTKRHCMQRCGPLGAGVHAAESKQVCVASSRPAAPLPPPPQGIATSEHSPLPSGLWHGGALPPAHQACARAAADPGSLAACKGAAADPGSVGYIERSRPEKAHHAPCRVSRHSSHDRFRYPWPAHHQRGASAQQGPHGRLGDP
eukprot:362964-Chlamydomonas_euryale.AAC.3